MGQTLTEKILAEHAGRLNVIPGENIWIDVDLLMTHDVFGPEVFRIFEREFGSNASVWDPARVVVIPDHFIFTSDARALRNLEVLDAFVRKHEISAYYPARTASYKGVCHATLASEGFNLPGTVLFGTDSHTCTSGAFGLFATGIGNTDAAFVLGTGRLWVRVPETMRFDFEGTLPPYLMAKDLILHVIGDIGVDGASYRSMEFGGEGIRSLSMEERMTLCNMAIEAGGKNGIIEADAVTRDYLAQRGRIVEHALAPDPDATYHSRRRYRSDTIAPTVAKPHSPDNRDEAQNLSDVRLDRCYIGSCTGGKREDFLAAARILAAGKVEIDTFVVPATTDVARELETEHIGDRSLLRIFQDAGCKIGPPSCGACPGGPPDTFGRANGSERVLSTTNRNFPGRMGSAKSEVYLASPLTVAASARTGRITDPREFMNMNGAT
ncbi:MAG TPA: aconitase/3-isopropylmalate dehydratase large subunit family protein [Candidatus Baltobacteraceae bacterium]|jgi:3-isopropylmalate/(R)-2-methylmalate dehydratase large subunit|nr:aconitase/3-isopropylmalate dehydratase large subunit family protein [Candidatus Baltobacteraceae bacterium]